MEENNLEKKIKELERKVNSLEFVLLLRKEENKPNALQGFKLGFSITTIIFVIIKQFF